MASKAYVASMTVAELKEELKQRGLSVKGSKRELKDRLEQAFDEEELDDPSSESDEESMTISSGFNFQVTSDSFLNEEDIQANEEAEEPPMIVSVELSNKEKLEVLNGRSVEDRLPSEGDGPVLPPPREMIVAIELQNTLESVQESARWTENGGGEMRVHVQKVAHPSETVEEMEEPAVGSPSSQEAAIERVSEAAVSDTLHQKSAEPSQTTSSPDTMARHPPVADTAEATPVADTAKATPVADTAKATPVADTAKATPVAERMEVTPVADTAEATPVADMAEATPVADTAKATPVADTAEATPVAERMEVTPVTNTAEATPVAERMEVTPVADTAGVTEKMAVIDEAKTEVTPATERTELMPVADTAEITPALEKTEVTPIVETSEMIPVAETAEGIPIVERTETTPVSERTEVTPVAEETKVTPEAEETEVTPVSEEKEVTPEAEETKVTPEAEETEVTPVSEEKEVTPEAEETEVIPVAEEKKVTPVAEETEVAPEAEEKEVTPEAEEKEVTPVAEETEVTPVTEETEVTPVTEETEVTPVSEEKEVTPEAEETEVTPVAEEKEVTPVAEEKEVIPVAKETEVTPEAEETSGESLAAVSEQHLPQPSDNIACEESSEFPIAEALPSRMVEQDKPVIDPVEQVVEESKPVIELEEPVTATPTETEAPLEQEEEMEVDSGLTDARAVEEEGTAGAVNVEEEEMELHVNDQFGPMDDTTAGGTAEPLESIGGAEGGHDEEQREMPSLSEEVGTTQPVEEDAFEQEQPSVAAHGVDQETFDEEADQPPLQTDDAEMVSEARGEAEGTCSPSGTEEGLAREKLDRSPREEGQVSQIDDHFLVHAEEDDLSVFPIEAATDAQGLDLASPHERNASGKDKQLRSVELGCPRNSDRSLQHVGNNADHDEKATSRDNSGQDAGDSGGGVKDGKRLRDSEMETKSEQPTIKRRRISSQNPSTPVTTSTGGQERKRRWGSARQRSSSSGPTAISSDVLKDIIPTEVESVGDGEPLEAAVEPEEGELMMTDDPQDQTQPEVQATEDKTGLFLDEQEREWLARESKREALRREAERARQEVDSRRKIEARLKARKEAEEKLEKKDRPRTPSPAKNPPSWIVHVESLTRPFTINQLKELLTEDGPLIPEGFWTDRVKSHCIALYQTPEDAISTRNRIHGLKWPSTNPKLLRVDFLTPAEVQKITGGELVVQEEEGKGEVVEVEVEVSSQVETESQVTTADASQPMDEAPVHSPKSSEKSQPGDEKSEPAAEKSKEEVKATRLLDELFRKTTATPPVYWLPLTEAQIQEKLAEEQEREVEREKRRVEREKHRAEEEERGRREREKRIRDEREQRAKERVRGRSRSPRRRRQSPRQSRSRDRR